ncbi:Putative ATPase [Mycobacteroides abscessus]|nr:Putative ATPase [Mycobacteroides abscessus]
MRPLRRISARNFRSLRNVDVSLGSLNVLVGPNEAGKSNFLDLIEFLGDSARYDLAEALHLRGGIERVRFRGSDSTSGRVSIHVEANVTTNSSDTAPDEYELGFHTRRVSDERSILVRSEAFQFKRTRGRGRRITVSGDRAEFITTIEGRDSGREKDLPLRSDSLALSTLRRLPPKEGGEEIERVAELFTSFRVFNVDVEKARRPGRFTREPMASDASNLASALLGLQEHAEAYEDFIADARAMIPGFETIDFVETGGAEPSLALKIVERGLRDSTFLADASFGSVRVLAILALLYDPNPPLITCIEEIDHGLHPYLFDRLVDRLREASTRTQLLIATHSPALVNRLDPGELVIVERQADGSTRLPAVSPKQIVRRHAEARDAMGLGELWFSGALGGVPR